MVNVRYVCNFIEQNLSWYHRTDINIAERDATIYIWNAADFLFVAGFAIIGINDGAVIKISDNIFPAKFLERNSRILNSSDKFDNALIEDEGTLFICLEDYIYDLKKMNGLKD